MSMSQSLRGHFLIAAKKLRDDNFYRTVVLIVEQNAEGAMGVVVNRPSSITVANALSEHFQLPDNGDVVYIGGPVHPQDLIVLHDRCDLDPDDTPVVPGLSVGRNSEVFEEVMRLAAAGCSELKYRIFCGCAGWAPQQLEGEIDRGDWFVVPASAALLFSEDPFCVWDEVRRRVHRSPEMLPDLPGVPEWN
ncbi:MAG: YqgE/AlgH family protein [Planctomycetaceae bacterium]